MAEVAKQTGKSIKEVEEILKKSILKEHSDFNPNVAAGSVYAIEVKPIRNGARLKLSQDNGQTIVADYDSIGDLIKVITSFYN